MSPPLSVSSLSSSSIPTIPKTLTLTLTPTHPLPRRLRFKHLHPPRRPLSLSSPLPLLSAATSSSSIHVEDLVERDWSFIDPPDPAAAAHRAVAAAGELSPESRLLVAMPAAGFVDALVESAGPCELLVAVHESLFALAMIKEAHDRVRCWQGGAAAVPDKFAPFDAVFVCYFPGMGLSIAELLASLAPRCSPGARVVICFDQGRQVVEQHRQQYPDMVTADLPDRALLEKAATENSYQITEFVDEPNFYLAVLRCQK